MKIKGSILAIEDVGSELKVSMQGAALVDGLGGMQTITFKVPDFERNRSAFRIGRDVEIEITLR
jgi:hypothetical protein